MVGRISRVSRVSKINRIGYPRMLLYTPQFECRQGYLFTITIRQQRAKSKEQRAESKEQRAKSREVPSNAPLHPPVRMQAR
jgi:hypothetical protein